MQISRLLRDLLFGILARRSPAETDLLQPPSLPRIPPASINIVAPLANIIIIGSANLYDGSRRGALCPKFRSVFSLAREEVGRGRGGAV